jgi:hypothetical protein
MEPRCRAQAFVPREPLDAMAGRIELFEVVIVMIADPDPDERVAVESANRSVGPTDADAPQIASHLLEVERRVEGVLLPEAVGHGRLFPNVPRQ